MTVDLRRGMQPLGAQLMAARPIPRRERSIAPKALRGFGSVAVYSNVVMAATGALLGLMVGDAVGLPEVISRPLAALALVIVLHPVALPYGLATVIAGFRTASGPFADAAWDVVFLLSFAPYLLVLCWLAARRLRAGRGWDALHLASLVGTYVCVCAFIILAQDTVIGVR